MHIITLITRRSIREVLTELRFRKYYSKTDFTPGSLIEIIDANKKSHAIILKSEYASQYKQEIRDGSLDIKRLVLSKSGPCAHGVVIEESSMADIRTYIKKPELAKADSSKNIRAFFPTTKRKPVEKKQVSATGDGSMATLSMDRYRQQPKTHHSELQLFVDEARIYFGEQAKYGQGSFSYYLGFCKKIPLTDLWQIYGEAKQTRKSRHDKKKLFWWKIGQYLKKDPL